MRYRLLGRTGLRVSELCLGAMVFGDRRGSWGASPEEAAAIVKRFAQAGGNLIDTANHYARGDSERIVGELARPDRVRWVLATKYPQRRPRRPQRRWVAPQEPAPGHRRQPPAARYCSTSGSSTPPSGWSPGR